MEYQGKNLGGGFFRLAKPFLGVIFVQFAVAGMEILSKVAMNQGMSSFVLIVYRHSIATLVMSPFAIVLERKARPKMTLPIFCKLLVLSLLEPVIDQNLYYLGMKYTTATFAATMCNIIPAVTFLMAWIFGLEEVAIKNIRSQAKIIGTAVTVTGAMVMTLMKGPLIHLFWTHGTQPSPAGVATGGAIPFHNLIKGSLMIAIGCISWSAFVILQAITLKTYPAELSMTAWICGLGTVGDVIVALLMERGNGVGVWAVTWDTSLVAVVYSSAGHGEFRAALLHPGISNERKRPSFHDHFQSTQHGYRSSHQLLPFGGAIALGKGDWVSGDSGRAVYGGVGNEQGQKQCTRSRTGVRGKEPAVTILVRM